VLDRHRAARQPLDERGLHERIEIAAERIADLVATERFDRLVEATSVMSLRDEASSEAIGRTADEVNLHVSSDRGVH
jgi:hypothetical protein